MNLLKGRNLIILVTIYCKLLNYNKTDTFRNCYSPKFDEVFFFIKSVILKIFEKSSTLNVDTKTYPDICCYLLNILKYNGIQLLVLIKYLTLLLNFLMMKCETNLCLESFGIRLIIRNFHTLLHQTIQQHLLISIISFVLSKT